MSSEAEAKTEASAGEVKPKTEEPKKEVPKEEPKKEEVKKENKEEEKKTPAKSEEKEKEKENETPKVDKENGAAAAEKLPTLREQFKAFSKFGDTKSDGKHLTLSQSDKWMKQAKIIAPKSVITTTDTAIHFKKFKSMKITFPDYDKYLTDLAKTRKQELPELKTKLRSCGTPGFTGATAVVKNEAVDRLTDTKKFTGSHKIRVDSPRAKTAPVGRK